MLVNKISPTRQEACKYDNKRMKNTLECRKINDNYEKTMLEIAWPRTQDKDFFFSNYAGDLCIISLREKQYNELCLKKMDLNKSSDASRFPMKLG